MRRVEFLNAHWFPTLEDARREVEISRADHNNERPHSTLGLETPAQFRAGQTEATNRDEARKVAELPG